MSARLLDVTPDEYLADPCERPSLSSSIAHTLVTKSPLHAWAKHPRLGGEVKPPTQPMIEGTILHSLLLGTGNEIGVVDANDYKTKVAREERDHYIKHGVTPILAPKMEELEGVADILRERLLEFGFELDGESEVAIEWEVDGVMCRAMLDHVYNSVGMILDVKKITSADSFTCSAHAYKYGYDIQHAAYTEAFEALHPEQAGRTQFVFLFGESEAPHAVVPRQPDGALVELGRRRWNRAREVWGRCMKANHWPSYATDIETLWAPSWAISQEEAVD